MPELVGIGTDVDDCVGTANAAPDDSTMRAICRSRRSRISTDFR
jgi:hypothetical protein